MPHLRLSAGAPGWVSPPEWDSQPCIEIGTGRVRPTLHFLRAEYEYWYKVRLQGGCWNGEIDVATSAVHMLAPWTVQSDLVAAQGPGHPAEVSP